MGIDVNRTRMVWVTVSGTLAGLGGAALTIGAVGAFSREMSAGQGYIALAALIFGRWNPWYAALAALFFGFATNLKNLASQVGSTIPSDLLAMPYLLTIFAIAGLVGKVRGPAASGKVYGKEV